MPRFAREGRGAIVNIASVVGLAPAFRMPVYGAPKSFVLFLSQGLHLELGPKGVYVQRYCRLRRPSKSGTTPART